MSNNYWFTALKLWIHGNFNFGYSSTRIISEIWIVLTGFEYHFQIWIFDYSPIITKWQKKTVNYFPNYSTAGCTVHTAEVLNLWPITSVFLWRLCTGRLHSLSFAALLHWQRLHHRVMYSDWALSSAQFPRRGTPDLRSGTLPGSPKSAATKLCQVDLPFIRCGCAAVQSSAVQFI